MGAWVANTVTGFLFLRVSHLDIITINLRRSLRLNAAEAVEALRLPVLQLVHHRDDAGDAHQGSGGANHLRVVVRGRDFLGCRGVGQMITR